MSDIDLRVRYGEMVPLADIARLFLAHQRAMRAALERRSIPIYEIGRSVVVPLRLVERAFGLEELLDDPDVRHQEALDRARYRVDRTRKPLEEYVAEVDARAGRWKASVEAVRSVSAE